MVCSEAYWRKSGCARSDAGVESQPHLPPALLVLGTSAVALHCPDSSRIAVLPAQNWLSGIATSG